MFKRMTLMVSVAVALAGLTSPATANSHGHDHPQICHPVGSATGGNQHNGYSLIAPADPSSHIDESLYPDGHYWKHEHDGRHDFYAVDGKCDDGSTPPPSDNPPPPASSYPYEVNACWQMDHPNMADQTSIEWPQTNVDKGTKDDPAVCPDQHTCEGAKYQYDWYWIRDDADRAYFEGLQTLNSPSDDASLEPHNYYVLYSAPDQSECTPTPPPPPPPVTKKKASFQIISYCNGVFVQEKHNIASIKKTHPAPRKYVFRATAKPGALFANGTRHATKVGFLKHHCGGGSDS